MQHKDHERPHVRVGAVDRGVTTRTADEGSRGQTPSYPASATTHFLGTRLRTRVHGLTAHSVVLRAPPFCARVRACSCLCSRVSVQPCRSVCVVLCLFRRRDTVCGDSLAAPDTRPRFPTLRVSHRTRSLSPANHPLEAAGVGPEPCSHHPAEKTEKTLQTRLGRQTSLQPHPRQGSSACVSALRLMARSLHPRSGWV